VLLLLVGWVDLGAALAGGLGQPGRCSCWWAGLTWILHLLVDWVDPVAAVAAGLG